MVNTESEHFSHDNGPFLLGQHLWDRYGLYVKNEENIFSAENVCIETRSYLLFLQ